MLPDSVVLAGIPSSVWLRAAGVAAASVAGALLVRALLVSRLDDISRRTTNPWDDVLTDVIRSTRISAVVFGGVFAGLQLLPLSSAAEAWTSGAAAMALLLQVALWCTAAARGVIAVHRERRPVEDRSTATMFAALSIAAQVLIWTVVLLLALDTLGVNITAFVASLGVGGVAIALATQKILGDLFASLAIVLDKPFVIGDFIAVGELMGTVEHVGLKTTRLRSLSGEQLVFSNSDLLDSRLRNYGRMQERRVVFHVGVTYQTPRELLERIPGMLRGAIESQAPVRFDRAHLASFNDFAIDFEVVYFVKSAEYNVYMDIQQLVNLSVHAQFEEAGAEFAYPTQTLLLQRAAGSTARARPYTAA
ncbi:MAG: mechanosensitive ion channel family protein [Gemmatimonadaceae bacterium]|nr:mechanosensitive ion channel family protein [Gemmatimonadaceae bacterium]